jgi:hypothetical protein
LWIYTPGAPGWFAGAFNFNKERIMRLQTKEQRDRWRQTDIDYHVKEHAAQVQNVYDIIIVTYQNNRGHYSLKIYKKNAARPFVNYYFKSEQTRQKYIDDNIASAESRVSNKNRRKMARKAATKNAVVAVGEIYRTSWGYDQTNVDFYQVVRVKGCFAWLQEIGATYVNGSESQIMPNPEHKIGSPKRKKICASLYTGKVDVCFKMCEWGCYARKWDGHECYQTPIGMGH